MFKSASRGAKVVAALSICFPFSIAASETEDPKSVALSAETWGIAYPRLVTFEIRHDIGPLWQPGDPIREIPRQHWNDPTLFKPVPPPVNAPQPDWLAELQRSFDRMAGRAPSSFTTPILNYEGPPGTTFPPDPTLDVGPNHVVVAVNASGGSRIVIYDKVGTQLASFELAPTLSGPSPCNQGLGDPIVIYDQLADRWLLTEFSPQSGRALCIYLSPGNDPTVATWYEYAFVMPTFPDYPKYGVWSDAYYVAANENTNPNRPVYALERQQMLAGNPARFVRLLLPKRAGFGFDLLTPVHLLGDQPPPAGAPGIFMRHFDDEAHAPSSNDPSQDFLQLWQLTVDWSQTPNPGANLSSMVSIPITEFNSSMNGLIAFNAFPQPNGQRLDPLREPIMNQLVYRNFGTHESIFGNFVTNLLSDVPQGTVHGAIRWFELRRTGGPSNPWQLHMEGTYAPTDPGGVIHRWMGASAIDRVGNAALAFSVTRETPPVHPGLRYVGRLESDPAGVMSTAETEIVAGTRSKANERWGDYFHMAVDPADDCTFWFFGEYMGPGSSASNTRVASFAHDACFDPSFSLSLPQTNITVCAANPPVTLPTQTLTVGSINGYTTPVNLGFNPAPPVGFSANLSPTTVTPPGTASYDVTIGAGVSAGLNTVVIEGVSGTITKTRSVDYQVFTQIPPATTLVSPADNATGQPVQPTLSWNAATQAQSYVVEVATDAAFTTIVWSGTANNATSIQVGTPLNTSTWYWWRVRPANVCGTGANSAAFRFRTQVAPGDCDADLGLSPVTIFQEDFSSGPGGFTTDTASGTPWTLSTVRPSPLSGGNAFFAPSQASVSDKRLVSPPISLPVGQNPLTLKYQNWRHLEQNGASGCYDGAILELAVGSGPFTQLTGAALLNDPYRGPVSTLYSNPIGGQPAWCDDPARNYADTLIDLSPYAGQTVRLRWRLATDSSVSREGWYVDDIRIQGCSATIFSNGFEAP